MLGFQEGKNVVAKAKTGYRKTFSYLLHIEFHTFVDCCSSKLLLKKLLIYNG
jgi:hypothetical protein